jgi:hypothetical protein
MRLQDVLTAPASACLSEGELDTAIRYRLVDVANRFDAILNNGDSAIDRRYGPSAEVASPYPPAPCRSGSFGALQDIVDRFEQLADRASRVVDSLGQA